MNNETEFANLYSSILTQLRNIVDDLRYDPLNIEGYNKFLYIVAQVIEISEQDPNREFMLSHIQNFIFDINKIYQRDSERYKGEAKTYFYSKMGDRNTTEQDLSYDLIPNEVKVSLNRHFFGPRYDNGGEDL